MVHGDNDQLFVRSDLSDKELTLRDFFKDSVVVNSLSSYTFLSDETKKSVTEGLTDKLLDTVNRFYGLEKNSKAVALLNAMNKKESEELGKEENENSAWERNFFGNMRNEFNSFLRENDGYRRDAASALRENTALRKILPTVKDRLTSDSKNTWGQRFHIQAAILLSETPCQIKVYDAHHNSEIIYKSTNFDPVSGHKTIFLKLKDNHYSYKVNDSNDEYINVLGDGKCLYRCLYQAGILGNTKPAGDDTDDGRSGASDVKEKIMNYFCDHPENLLKEVISVEREERKTGEPIVTEVKVNSLDSFVDFALNELKRQRSSSSLPREDSAESTEDFYTYIPESYDDSDDDSDDDDSASPTPPTPLKPEPEKSSSVSSDSAIKEEKQEKAKTTLQSIVAKVNVNELNRQRSSSSLPRDDSDDNSASPTPPTPLKPKPEKSSSVSSDSAIKEEKQEKAKTTLLVRIRELSGVTFSGLKSLSKTIGSYVLSFFKGPKQELKEWKKQNEKIFQFMIDLSAVVGKNNNNVDISEEIKRIFIGNFGEGLLEINNVRQFEKELQASLEFLRKIINRYPNRKGKSIYELLGYKDESTKRSDDISYDDISYNKNFRPAGKFCEQINKNNNEKTPITDEPLRKFLSVFHSAFSSKIIRILDN